MDGITPQLAMCFLGSAFIGGALVWLIYGARSRRLLEQHADEWQNNVDNVVRTRDRLISEAEKLRATIEAQQSAVNQAEQAKVNAATELDSAHEREKQLSKNIFTLRNEREETKLKMTSFQNALVQVKQQAIDIQTEFLKSRDFYKNELIKAFERRKALEIKLDDARAEQDSFTNLLKSSASEKASVNNMLNAAQRRLDNMDALEHKVIKLEADNAQLTHNAATAKREIEILQRDVDELEDLKVQNRELALCLKSLEDSRKQYESDALRYKERAGKSEQKSETLRIKLDEVEKNFLDIEQQQSKALKDARKTTLAGKSNGKSKPKVTEEDNLQDIVGIGKVFEQTLHELGITSFRQIAAFDVNDIARVNRELKEFKGRMEQDDWIGQAKELHYKKYGNA
jgi:predicted flap endonuclease-1-like 5' DNA nuclease